MNDTLRQADELLRRGERGAAEAAYRQALVDEAGNAYLRGRIGLLAFQRGAVDDALAMLSKAVDVMALFNRRMVNLLTPPRETAQA